MPIHAPASNLAGQADPAIDALYHDIVQRHAADVLGNAARTIDGGDSIDEPGVLRVVLARLLLHEPNVSQLAARAATLANAVARLVTVQQRDQASDDEQEIDAILDELTAIRTAALINPEGVTE
jgi:hypothetical protein